MKKKRYAVLFLTVSLLFCACTKEAPVSETVVETISLPTAAEETETVPMTTAPTVPPHSDLYHPDYTTEQIQEYFEEVILHVEYSSGTGDATLVQKWLSPIGYRIYGSPTDEDLRVLNDLFARLNQIPGFPGFYTAEAEGLEQLRISFLEPDTFRASYSPVVNGEEANGATEFWYYTGTNEIYSARIGYRTDIDQSIRNSVLIEEIINTLGVSDTVLREDSITYQYSDFNTALSDVDWILLNLLYHPEIRCGMDADACADVLQRLYH